MQIVPPYALDHFDKEILVEQDGFVRLPCSIMGYPIPFVAWEKLIDDHWRLVEEAAAEGHESAMDISTTVEDIIKDEEKKGEKLILHMEGFSGHHQGQYRCRGSNDAEEVVLETVLTLKRKHYLDK